MVPQGDSRRRAPGCPRVMPTGVPHGGPRVVVPTKVPEVLTPRGLRQGMPQCGPPEVSLRGVNFVGTPNGVPPRLSHKAGTAVFYPEGARMVGPPRTALQGGHPGGSPVGPQRASPMVVARNVPCGGFAGVAPRVVPQWWSAGVYPRGIPTRVIPKGWLPEGSPKGVLQGGTKGSPTWWHPGDSPKCVPPRGFCRGWDQIDGSRAGPQLVLRRGLPVGHLGTPIVGPLKWFHSIRPKGCPQEVPQRWPSNVSASLGPPGVTKVGVPQGRFPKKGPKGCVPWRVPQVGSRGAPGMVPKGGPQ